MMPGSPPATAATNSSPVVLPKLTESVRNLVLQQQQASPGSSPQTNQHCLVCYSDLDYATILPCHHNEVCPVCVLRLRFLHHDTKCPICKAPHDQVIVDTRNNNSKLFDDYPIWGDELGNNFCYRANVGMFFPVDYFAREIQPLFGFPCTCRGCSFDGSSAVDDEETTTTTTTTVVNNSNNNNNNKSINKTALRSLQDHLRVQHRLTLCGLCLDHPRDFVARLQRFTPSQLKDHLTKGDGSDSGFTGHPVCEFCRPKRFYDLSDLYKHLTKDHYKCHVCEQLGMDNQYFRDYAALEKHFDRQHFMCLNAQCVAARFVVFGNEIDLADHQRSVHNMAASDTTKIQLQFRVARRSSNGRDHHNQAPPDQNDFNYGLDGEAFVPAALPESQGELALHPRHVERTAELRVMAAAMRDTTTTNNEAFPTLQAASAANDEDDMANASSAQQLRMGWTDGTSIRRAARAKPAGAVTREDFPTLPAAPKVRPASAKLHAGKNQAMATQNAASRNGWSGAAATVPTSSSSSAAATSFLVPAPSNPARSSTSNLTTDNFPSLGPPGTVQQRQGYSAANALAKRIATQQPMNMGVGNFPSLGRGPTHGYGSLTNRPVSQQPTKKGPPSMSSDQDFPAPPASSQPLRSKIQDPSAPTASAVATVENMKAVLGSVKYKILKGFTREFAAGELESEAFVDHSASLFDKGYADDHFWSFIPVLVASCPDHYASAKAMRYMEHLKVMRNGALNAEAAQMALSTATANDTPSSSQLSAPVLASAIASRYTPSAPPVPTIGRYVPPPSAATSVSSRGLQKLRPGTKAKSAWGSSSAKSLQTAGHVDASLNATNTATTAPSGNSAKQVAKEAQSSQVKIGYGNTTGIAANNKKKKKQNDELKKLAFG